jgi:lysophospholipase L1-like esterase
VYLRRVLLLLVSLGLAVVLGEVVLRTVGYNDGRASLKTFGLYDPLLGWRIKPNTHTTIREPDYSTVLDFGPKGLRGKDIPYMKSSGVSRVLILGDSLVDGYSVPLENRVSEVLESRLGPRAQVVNLGVSGYSTDQELLMLESEGMKYQPDLVVLFLYYNDIWMNGERLVGRATFKPFFKLDKSGNPVLMGVPVPHPSPALEDRFKFYALIRDVIKRNYGLYKVVTLGHGWPAAALPMPGGAGGTADQFRVYQKEDAPELKRVWAITRALLKRMNQETQEHGGRFLVFYAPSRVELSPEEWRQSNIPDTYAADVVLRHVTEICTAEGIALLDPTERFREARKDGPLSYAHDIHWTKAGHRVTADLLMEYIQKNGLGKTDPQIRAQNTPAGR